MSWNIIGQDQDWVLATAHEIACHGEEEVRVSFKHFGHELVGRLHRDLRSLGGYLSRPAAPKCALVFSVAHLRTPAHGLCQHSGGNTIGGALQKAPDERSANAEAQHHKLVDPQ